MTATELEKKILFLLGEAISLLDQVEPDAAEYLDVQWALRVDRLKKEALSLLNLPQFALPIKQVGGAR